MSQSLAKNLIHLVFSTKGRQPFLQNEIRDRFHEYACGVLRDIQSPALSINSVDDHVHVLLNLNKNQSLSDVIKELKRGTSIWMKTLDPSYEEFYWQSGYGAFSVSQSAVESVKIYIANQQTHHQRQSFQDEFRELLTRHEIEFDERFVWD